jgi:hypothetical protein
MTLAQNRLTTQNIHSFLKKLSSVDFYNSFLFVEECNTPYPKGFSIFVEAPLSRCPQTIAMHLSVQWPHCVLASEQ